MSPNDEEIAWAAGFFEADGSTSLIESSYRRKDGSRRSRFSLQVTQTGDELPPQLFRFCSILGVGKINGPYGPYNKLTKRPIWQYLIRDTKAKIVIEYLAPYMTADGPKLLKA